jgi:hypothetical protein
MRVRSAFTSSTSPGTLHAVVNVMLWPHVPKYALHFLTGQLKHHFAQRRLYPGQLTLWKFILLREHDLIQCIAEHARMEDMYACRLNILQRRLAYRTSACNIQ